MKLNTRIKVTKEEYYDGRECTIQLKLSPMSVSVFSYCPFTKEELLERAEKKAEEIRIKLEKEALEKANVLKKLSLKENLESKVHAAQEKISGGAEAEKEIKVIRKKRVPSTSKQKNTKKK